MKRKKLLLLLPLMVALIIPLIRLPAAAVDGLVVGSTVELSYEEKYLGTDGKTYKGGDIRTLHVGTFMSVCVEPNVKITNGSYTVSNAKADPVILRAIYYYEQIKNNASYPDTYAALQYAIWDPTGSWAPTDEYGGVVGRPAEAAYHYILQGVKSGTPSADELNTIYDGQYCMLDSPVASQRQLVWATKKPINEKGSITIHKVDGDNNPLAGAVFTVYDSTGAKVPIDFGYGDDGILVTDANGYATTGTDALDFGTYKIVETTPPDGYPDTGWQRTVTVGAGNQDVTVTVINWKSGSIIVKKVDQYGNPVPGVVFGLWLDYVGDEYETIAQATTDENGLASFDDLVDGNTYFIQELSAPEGYVPDNTYQAVTVDINNTVTLTFVNENTTPQTTEITVTKKWKDSNNAWGLRPDSVTLRLHANGVEVAHAVVSGSATADSWSYTFTDLPIEDGGVPIVYTVTEDPVRNYSTKIDGLTVTNEYVPIVPTGIALDIAPYAVLLLMGTLGAAALMKKKDR